MENTIQPELINKFSAVVHGPDGDLLLSLLDILYDRITEADYDDQYLSPEDIEAIQRGLEEIRQGRSLTLEEYRSGKRL
ncbi:MAG: hypothetical protein FJ135_06315 [Deltaproteobacteria bacterium]|nr:hypothetical protein [Deltaproteobacteria bacterium]